MRLILLAILLTLPAAGFSQSLGEVAKKERERREKNKQEGKKVLTFTETEIFGEEAEGEQGEGSETAQASAAGRSPGAADSNYTVSEVEAEQAPKSIPADLPLEVKIRMFEQMKAHYQSQVRELDAQIAKNEEKIAELDDQIRKASSSGGAGLPVAPTAQSSDQLYTGQESETLVAEQNKLKALNERLEARKGQLKANVIAQGRIANLPAGYLRF